MRLKDNVAVITGAGKGIGRAFALRFAAEGAKVVIADIDLGNAQKVAEEIEAKGGEALALHADVSDEASTSEMAKKTVERFGRIDILINNAVFYSGIGFRAWDSWTTEEWEMSFATNVMGGWLCAKAVSPYMKAQGKGKVINVSDAAFESGFSALLPYSCSKGAVVSFTRCLGRALGREGIKVNCISPGYTLSEATIEMPGRTDRVDQAMAGARCIRRAEFEEDIVGTAVFLASEDSDFITGQTIAVDGGQILR